MPNEYKRNVHDIDYRNIKLDGYNTIIFDLDNTLAPYSELEPSKELRFFISFLKDLGYRVFIASNSGMERVEPFLKNLEVEGVGPAYKPLNIGIKKLPNIEPKKTMFVGDQLMTDCFVGKRNGFYTILVEPIIQKQDKWMTRINRYLENKVINKIKRDEPEYYDLVLKKKYESS